MRVAGQHVHEFVSVVLHSYQHLINLAATGYSGGKLIHAVIHGNTFWQGFVHSNYHGVDRIILAVPVEHALDPFHLRGIKLVGRRIIQVDEINTVAHPMKIGLRLRCLGIIFQPLLANVWTVEICMKLSMNGARLLGGVTS